MYPTCYTRIMVHSRPFRFAAELHAPLPDRSWADSARELEALGYSTLFVPDHFDEGLGPIASLAAAATATTTLNVGALVLDCDFRHPAVLARELATIDLLSQAASRSVSVPVGNASTTTEAASPWTARACASRA